MARLGRQNRQSGFRGAPSGGTGPTPQFERRIGPRPPRATTAIPLPRTDQLRIRVLSVVRGHRLSWRKRHPLQGWEGSRQREATALGLPVPGVRRLLGPQPPEVVLPLPTQQQQTISRSLQAIRTSRRVHNPRGLIRRSAPASTAITNIDAVSGSASPSGSVVEAWSVLSLSQMTIDTRIVAVPATRTRRALRFTSKLGRGPAITVTTDVVTGAASPTGTMTESWSVLALSQMTVRATLAAVQIAGLRRRIRIRSRIGRGAVITITTDTPTGAAAPSGSITEQKLYTETLSGTASPFGAALEQWSVLTLAQMTIRVRLSALRIARLRRSIVTRALIRKGAVTVITTDIVTGSASPSGMSTDARIGVDAPTGTSSASGSSSDDWSKPDTPAGTASPTGSVVEARVATDAVTGSAVPAGTADDARSAADAVTGTAAPAGSIVEAWFRGAADAPTGSAGPSGSLLDALTHASVCVGVSSAGGSATDTYTPPFVPPTGGAGGAKNHDSNWGRLITDRRSPRTIVVDDDGFAKVVTRKKRKAEDEDELLILGLLE